MRMIESLRKNRLLQFYSFTFIISWVSWSLMTLVHRGKTSIDLPTFALSSIGGFGPLLSLLILQRISSNEVEVDKILDMIKLRDGERKWFAAAIFIYPASCLLGNLLYFIFRGGSQLLLLNPDTSEQGLIFLPLMVIHYTVSLITSPFLEEPGWRGFALGRLQSRYGREGGSLLVGALWWIWHQPMWFTFGREPSVYSFLNFVSFSFMTDSLFNLSGRNLFTAMLAHQSMGTTAVFLNEGNKNIFKLVTLIFFVFMLRIQESKSRLSSKLNGQSP
jgi:membrane protease YdiL (CAAX protease family)